MRDLAARVRDLADKVTNLADPRRRSYSGLHHPMDAQESTYPPRFDPPIVVDGEPLPLPPASLRAGYSPDDDARYLKWGKFDHDFILNIAGRYIELQQPLRILDFGCSTGRVLRHFETEREAAGWRLHGVDTQARLIEWLRSFWPSPYDVCTTNEVVPVLPFEDNYFDIIYGISVFPHIKYLWDGSLCELRRCLKPGGLCLQTVHCEEAWRLFARGDAEWQITGVPDDVRQHPQMDVDYLLFNKETTSNTFYKRSVVEKMFGRHMPVREILDPPEFSIEHWVVMQKEWLRPELAADELAPVRAAQPGAPGDVAGQPDPAAPDSPRPDEAELARRIDFIRGLSNEETARVGMARVGAEIGAILDDPLFEEWPIDKQLPMVQRIAEIYFGHWHASGHALIPALERLFHRAVATPEVTLDTLCMFYDLLFFLYWYVASDYDAMRGIADRVMKPFAAAIRGGAVRDLPTILPRPVGNEPLRLGYLSQFATSGNPIGPCAHAVLGALSRYLPGTYRLVLYAWGEQDDAFLAALPDTGILVRRFTANSMSERISAVAETIADDEIDLLITDMNSALPTVLFERRVAPVQIFFQLGLPFWPLANIDGVFRIQFDDPKLDGFEPDQCFPLGLGAWDAPEYAPLVGPARIAAERARIPPAAKLLGTYGRFAKITVDFLDIINELLVRQPQLVVVLGGTGDGKWIRDFIAAHGLAGRLVLVEEYVDGHVWGHMLDVFLDTFPLEGGVSSREVMAKGKPVVSMRNGFAEHERVPMLIADSPAMYADIVSRLIEDRDFYETACAATRDFVAAQPGAPNYGAAIHDALSTIVRRVRERSADVSPELRESVLVGKIEKIRGLSNEDTARMGMDRVGAEIGDVLGDPVFAEWPLEKQLPMFRRVYEIYGGHWHASGHALIPTIEPFFRRALATPGVTLDALCVFYDLLYHLYFFVAGDYNAMRGVADQVMKPFVAAIRYDSAQGLPAIVQRPIGGEPLRLGYLAYFPDWPWGPFAQSVLIKLSRHFPGAYQSVLYAWAGHDGDALAAFADTNILVRRFPTGSISERISAVAEAVAADEIDILMTDFNMALPTVLFERRVAPVQIFVQIGLPFWPIGGIDGVFHLDAFDPEWEAFPPEKCFRLDLGVWDLPEYAAEVDPARVAAERARLPPASKLVGTYVRFAKVTTGFLDIVAELLARHRQLVVVLGGIGDGKVIHDFIGAQGLDGRLVLIEEYVDCHVWGHLLDVFLDTFPLEGGVACREVMAKGKPVVSLRSSWTEHDRAPMLIADNPAMYADIVSRLIEDHNFYEAACAATREFIAAQPGEAEYIAAIHDALSSVTRRVAPKN